RKSGPWRGRSPSVPSGPATAAPRARASTASGGCPPAIRTPPDQRWERSWGQPASQQVYRAGCLSLNLISTAEGVLRCIIDDALRCRGDRSPTTRALLHIWIVALGILTIVPEGLRRRLGRLLGARLDIDLRRGRNDGRRIDIRVSIRAPVGFHERPDGEHDARPDEDTPMTKAPAVMEAPAMMEAPTVTEAMPTARGRPVHRA